MNINMEFERLDDLIVEHTRPPSTEVLREQLQLVMERYAAEHTALETEYIKLKNAQGATPPKPPNYASWGSSPRLKMRTEM